MRNDGRDGINSVELSPPRSEATPTAAGWTATLATAVLNSLPAQIAILDQTGTILAVNKNWARAAADNPLVRASDRAGTNYLATCTANRSEHEAAGPAFARAIRFILAGVQNDFQLEYRCDSQLQRRWFSASATKVDSPGSIHVLISVQDVTALKTAEEERVLLSTAIEQAAETVVITDRHGMILYVNPAFEKVTGYSRREVIGQNPRILKSGQHDADFYRTMWETLARGETWHGRLINLRKDGKPYTETASISPVRNSSGEIEHYVALKLDVSREAKLEAQFLQAQKLEAVGRLTGGVAHDFNNMLSVIMMQSELASLDESLPAQTMEAISEVQAAAQRAANLTRQLLLFSRQQPMQLRSLDLNEVVTTLGKMLRRLIGEDVTLDFRVNAKPLVIHADPSMLDQLLLNLAVNARDAMPDGGRLLMETAVKNVDEEVARAHGQIGKGAYAWLSVTDSGVGIPPEILPKIFDPFFTTKEPGKGTGLGLATVFGIVQQHQGWITVYSEPGRGSNFQIFIPLSALPADISSDQGNSPSIARGSETILLVEDDETLRGVTRTTLERNGYRVYEAGSGQEALSLWREHGNNIDLLITDLIMPGGISGRQLAEEIRSTVVNLKIIYTSGYSGEMPGQPLKLNEGERFLQKPFSRVDLLELIRNRLEK